MNGQEIIKIEKAVLKIEYLPSLNYSMLNNGVETCSKCVLENVDQHDWHQVQISIRGELIKGHVQRLEFLRKGQSVQIGHFKILPDIKKLSEITEAINTTFTVTVEEQSGQLLQQELPRCASVTCSVSISPTSLQRLISSQRHLVPSS